MSGSDSVDWGECGYEDGGECQAEGMVVCVKEGWAVHNVNVVKLQ